MGLTNSFNLWTEPWIRVTWMDGSLSDVGIVQCLSRAHEIYGLSDPSPLVVCGTHRFLTAILQFIYNPNDLFPVEELWAQRHFDEGLLEKFAQQYRESLDLFHPEYPFLQTPEVPSEKDQKPVALLLAEVPTGTNRTLFHHVSDDTHAFCPACCARGIVAIPAFASSGGKGIRPSINGVPPIYVVPIVQTLFDSLTLSILTPEHQPTKAEPKRVDTMPWGMQARIQKDYTAEVPGYIESLLFPARRVHLVPETKPGLCTQCGLSSEVLIRGIGYEMGHWLDKGIGQWDDPFIATRIAKAGKKDQSIVSVRPVPGKSMWREYNTLLLASDAQDAHRPKMIRQLVGLINREVLPSDLRFRCFWMRTDNKAKIFEWGDESLDASPSIIRSPESKLHVDEAIKYADTLDGLMNQAYARFFSRRKQEKAGRNEAERFVEVRARMKEIYWLRLEPSFREFIQKWAKTDDPIPALEDWKRDVIDKAERVFLEVVDQMGTSADTLRRRVEARDYFLKTLNAKRKEGIL